MIYRFKIKQFELYDKMIEFSSYHKYETSDVLKQHFESWCNEEDVMTLISREESLLKENHYDFKENTIQDKIFKSIKYYHIKRMLKEMNLHECKDEKQKRGETKTQFSKNILDKTREYFESNLNKIIKPSLAFIEFKEKYDEDIKKEKSNMKNDEKFDIKLKKMFKNQYFVFHN